MGNTYKTTYAKNAWAEVRGPKTRMLKVSFGRFNANRASETEEQRKERLRIRREKIEQEGNGRPRETAPGHSQNIEVR